MRIAAVILLKFLPALALLTLIFGLIRIPYMFRARAMRALAARWGFQYIGPPFSGWRTSSSPQIKLLFPFRFLTG
jgi:hypothetical protein